MHARSLGDGTAKRCDESTHGFFSSSARTTRDGLRAAMRPAGEARGHIAADSQNTNTSIADTNSMLIEALTKESEFLPDCAQEQSANSCALRPAAILQHEIAPAQPEVPTTPDARSGHDRCCACFWLRSRC